MNRTRSLLRTCAVTLAVLLGLASWHPRAEAFGFDDFIEIVSLMDQAHVNPFPVKASELATSKNFISELAAGHNVLEVIAKYKDDPMVVKYAGELPPWLDRLVDALIAVQDGKFWGVVTNLGEAAVCVIAQVMAAGIDLCGLIKDLIAIGEALYDAAKAIGEFFGDLGAGVYSAVACGVFGDCGSGPPPEKTTYECFFAPEVKTAGLTAMKAVDASAFNTLRNALIAKAQAGGPCATSFPSYYKADSGPATKAAEIFTNAVEGVWSADVMTNVLGARDSDRIKYLSTQQINASADAATAAFQANKSSPKMVVVDSCTQHFSVKLGYAHVDRWLLWRQTGKTKIQQQAMGLTNVTSNRSWCESDFFGKNVEKFAEHFRTHAKLNYCPLFGQQLTCATVEKYKSCTALMGSVNKAAECGANAASLGAEIAAKIDTAFKTGKGATFKVAQSTHPCTIVKPDGGAPIGNKPVEFLCTRPTQQHFCEKEYQALWKSSVPVLKCSTPQQLIPAPYQAQMQKVKQAVATLQAKYPTVNIDKYDPLLVATGKLDIYEALKKAQGQRTSSPASPDEAKFTYLAAISESIDGVSRPTMIPSVLLEKQPTLPVMKPSLKENLVKPGDPDPLAQPVTGALKQDSPVMSAPVGAAALGATSPGITGTPVPMTSGSAPPEAAPATMLPGGPALVPGTPGMIQGNRGRTQSSLPAVQQPSLPAVQQLPAPAMLPPLPPARSPSRPAPDSPAGPSIAPPRSGTPDWGALGNAPRALPPPPAASRGAPVPPPPAASRVTTPPPARTGAPVVNAPAAVERALAAAGCTRSSPAGLRYACTTRAGFERCEALRLRKEIEQCALNVRR